jgi:hypothetical protein
MEAGAEETPGEQTDFWQEGDYAILEELAAEEERIRPCRPLWTHLRPQSGRRGEWNG